METKEPRPTSPSVSSSELPRTGRGEIRRALRALVLLLVLPAAALGAPRSRAGSGAGSGASVDVASNSRAIDSSTLVDHDGYPPISKPSVHEANIFSYYVRYGFVEPIAELLDAPGGILWLLDRAGIDTEHRAVNVNDFDEVPNSTWFSNRNHFMAVSIDQIRRGPEDDLRPATPWKITGVKKEGMNPGFQIKDSAGHRWLVKLDAPGYPQAASGSGIVNGRLLFAAGYNVPHEVALTFKREELYLDSDLVKGKDGDPPFTESDLDDLLARGHRGDDGRFYALASLFASGKPIGHLDMSRRRKDDPNDWYTHRDRRELRGLYVIASWLNHWDMKDQQSLEMFESEDSLGVARRYLLDFNATLGAAAAGAKKLPTGYEYGFDPGWMLRRLVTLGFIEEPWRRAKQETGIPSVGNFAADFDPGRFKTIIPNPAFIECTASDAYWGAKIVASFSDPQIDAALEAANYEDPRAVAFLHKALVQRRDEVARYWFARVAPLDFFEIEEGELRFHDLGVDRGLEEERAYEVRIESLEGSRELREIRLESPSLGLDRLDNGAKRVRLVFSIDGLKARPAVVEIEREGVSWHVTRVRHG